MADLTPGPGTHEETRSLAHLHRGIQLGCLITSQHCQPGWRKKIWPAGRGGRQANIQNTPQLGAMLPAFNSTQHPSPPDHATWGGVFTVQGSSAPDPFTDVYLGRNLESWPQLRLCPIPEARGINAAKQSRPWWISPRPEATHMGAQLDRTGKMLLPPCAQKLLCRRLRMRTRMAGTAFPAQ